MLIEQPGPFNRIGIREHLVEDLEPLRSHTLISMTTAETALARFIITVLFPVFRLVSHLDGIGPHCLEIQSCRSGNQFKTLSIKTTYSYSVIY